MYIEVKLPREIVKPTKAMETVFAAIHGAIYNPPDWWETYIEGQPQTGTCFDIISVGGIIHFYIRFHSDHREQVEAAVYSQYPEAEIEAVPDYTNNVPLNIPNKDWMLYGWDYKLEKQDHYPLLTYKDFEEPGEKEEEKVDPLASLMEGLAKIKPGEQMWIQIRASPRGEADHKKFFKEGEALRDKLAFRKVEEKAAPLWSSLAKFIFQGVSEEEEKPQELIPLEMKLTPGERKNIEDIERKISKPIFMCGIRVIYLGRKEVWYKPNFRLAFNYFNNFNNQDNNSLSVWSRTFTRTHKSWFLPFNYLVPRLNYIKQRRLFRVYKGRDNYLVPLMDGDRGRFILNIEELATLYHFPSQEVAPTPGIHRTEAKETVAPFNLPT